MERAMFIVTTTKPIREMDNFARYCEMTEQLDESNVDKNVYRFFTNDCKSLVAVMRADNDVIDAEFFYWI